MSPARQNVFVGIDVAKDWLDIAVRPTGAAWRVAQDDEGIADLVRQLAKLQPRLIVMEASGGYERLPAIALDAARLPVAVVNARHVREFAKSQGKLAKTDPFGRRLGRPLRQGQQHQAPPLADGRGPRARSPRHAPPPAHPDADRRTAAPPAGASLSPAQHRPHHRRLQSGTDRHRRRP